MSKAGEHLLGLINDVLDLSSIDAKRIPMSLEPVRLEDVVSESISLLRPLCESREIRLVAKPWRNDLFVCADRQRLKQVVINMLTNAAKYNRPKGRITVSVRLDEDDYIGIDVADEGMGIAPEMIERLFTPFDRLGAENTGIEGTGLGLTISRGLVDQMGGRMSIESVVGEGSTFTVHLPVVASPICDLPPLDEPLPLSDVPSQDVLYIEDNESNILLMQRILRQRPEIRLTTSKSVFDGFERLAHSSPAVLLLDLNLPDGSGESIIHWVRTQSTFPELPIIVLSADATPRQSERILAAGADRFLTKPLNLPTFLQTLDRSLERRA